MPAACRRLVITLAAGTALLLSGCATLADRIVTPSRKPLLDEKVIADAGAMLGIRRATYRPDAGPSLAYLVVPAARYGFAYAYERGEHGAGIRFSADLSANAGGRPEPVPVKGTVVMLHGWSMDGASMLPWALALGERGYRSILVDLRGHGASAKAAAGYGPAEGEDVAGLVAELQRTGEIQGTAALFGVSYGAVAGLHAAARLRHDIGGVIAMSPYANAADGIRGMFDATRKMRGGSLQARLLHSWLRLRYDDAALDAAIAEAGRRIGTDLATLDTAPTIATTTACIALLHGSDDEFFPIGGARALAGASAQVRFVELEGETHLTAPMRIDLLAGSIADWLDALQEPRCPSFALPA